MQRPPYLTPPDLLDEHGFTLIELLVAMVAGMAVIGALFGILEVSLHQTANLTDRVQSNQNGRIAMTRIIDALHSTCLSPEFKPIQESSSENDLSFVNAYSNEANIPYTAVSKHEIIWNKAAGTLTEKRYSATSGTWPEYKFPTSATSTTLIASNIAESQEGGKSVPIFEYFKYNTTSSSASETLTPLSTINPTRLTVPLSLSNAAITASVAVRFTAYPSDGDTLSGRGVDFRNQVTLAMSAPSSETPIEAEPCE
jgi:Tfp pilus assembly protein PilW